MARRKQRVEPAAPSAAPVETPSGGEPAVRGVGATLRDARERRGWTIPDIAQQLRIRATVLQAMEAGHFEKLPNGAYALGFVRSYADFLGLDRDEIARRVKAEAAALSAPTELVFPKPLTESRMPSGVVLIISLILAVGGYGLWYYHSASVRQAAPRVEAVPERLIAQADRANTSPSKAEAATVAPAAPPAAAPTPDAKPAPVAAAPSPNVAPAAPADNAPAADVTSPPASSAPVEAPAQVAAVPANAGAEANALSSPPASEPKPAPAPRQYGETDGTARIVIKATADSWVQVRDPAGAVIFSRILRPGDSYGVPNRPGQVLATGSAGALDIVIDGKTAPPIGRSGFTQKDVPLDPTRLLAGTAVVETPRTATRPARPAAPATTPPPPAAAPPSPPPAAPAPAERPTDG